MNPNDFPIHDASRWPLRMKRAEVSAVLRISVRTLRDRVAHGRFPAADGDGTWARELVKRYVTGGITEFERRVNRAPK